MNIFWLTPATLKTLYGDDFRSVSLFSSTHFIEFGLAIVLTIVFFIIYKKANRQNKDRILLILTILIWLDEIIKYVSTIATDQWIWNYLPLHLCSLNIFTCTLHTITKSDKIKDFLYGVSIPGALLALISSPWFTAPIFNIMHLHSYSIHVLLIIYSVIVLADGYRPSLKQIPLNTLVLILICIPMYFLNQALGTNFLYLNNPNEVFITKALYNLFGYYYPLSFPAILILIWLALYLPWYFLKPKKNK